MDPSHFAYYVFEGLRRLCGIEGKSVKELFNFALTHDSFRQKVVIKRDEFWRQVANLRIENINYIRQDLERLLQTDPHTGDVDLMHLTALIGVS